MKKNKITIDRAVKCYSPCRLTEGDKNYSDTIAFEKRYGFRYEDCWNLNVAAAYFILVRLVHLRDVDYCTPDTFFEYDENWKILNAKEGAQRWHTVLDKMIRGLYLYITNDFPNYKEKKIMDKGFKLLCEHWRSLWY